MRSKRLPKFLKGYFWSVDFNELDLEKDKNYIIHQILSLGDLKAINWLFRNYKRQEVVKSFVRKPTKIYRPATFNFVKLLLDLNKPLNPRRYVINIPRDIR